MLIKNILLVVALVFMALVGQARAQQTPVVAIATNGNSENIILAIPEHNPQKVFTLTKPDRLVIDVPSMPHRPNITMPAAYHGNLVKSVRFGQFSEHVSRFVFDLQQPVQVLSVSSESRPPRLVVKIGTSGKARASEKNITQKKKSTPLIMIDAGHGGHDPGTIGRHKTREKILVLEYAKSLQYVLEQSGRYKVQLTRTTDEYISLKERVALARKVGADLFISLHADSAPKSTARGLSVYTLSENASDKEAAALAERENSAGALSSIDLSNEREDVADILISLAQRETNNFSATLADMIVEKARSHGVPLLPRSHRFAGFAVLKAPDIPSVLVEIGFLSNNDEEQRLKTGAYRRKVVKAIASGIDAFFEYRNELE